MGYDLLIADGLVIDGTGAPARRAHVAVSGGRVAEIGTVRHGARRVIDAEGHVVAPGFIDVHTHYDAQIAWDPLASPACWHGVTTIVTGNCGFTVAPARAQDREFLASMLARVEGIPLSVLRATLAWDWETFGDYRRQVAPRLGINVASLVGHNAVRRYVMGAAAGQRLARPDEVERMKDLVRIAMAQGAFGFSTTQNRVHHSGDGSPVPSRLADEHELRELCGVLAEFGFGIIGLNPGGITDRYTESGQRLLETLSRSSGRPLVWNELAVAEDQPMGWKAVTEFMERAALRGAQIYGICRCQPLDNEFNFEMTTFFDLYPAWKDVLVLPHAEKKRLLADAQVRERLRAEMDAGVWRVRSQDWAKVHFGACRLAANKRLEGKCVVEIARAAGKAPLDVALDVALQEDLATEFIIPGFRNTDEDVLGQIIASPRAIIGISDGGAHINQECGADFVTHFLGHWVREVGLVPLEEAVHRLTAVPAGLLGLKDRGVLRPGAAADITIFDPATIRPEERSLLSDLPGGGARLTQKAVGVRATLVNGEVLTLDGQHAGPFPGRMLDSRAVAQAAEATFDGDAV